MTPLIAYLAVQAIGHGIAFVVWVHELSEIDL